MEDEKLERQILFNNMPILREIERKERGDDEDEKEEEIEIEDTIFTQQQIDEFEVCFKTIDKANTGWLQLSEVSGFMRATGTNPTVRVLENINDWLKESKIDKINFEESIRILQRIWEDPDAFKLRDAVEELDRERNGFFKVDQLKSVLLNYGECLNDEEFKEFLKDVKVRDGTIYTEDLIKLLTSDIKK